MKNVKISKSAWIAAGLGLAGLVTAYLFLKKSDDDTSIETDPNAIELTDRKETL